MKNKWKLPTIISVCILIAGIIGLVTVTNYWNTKEIVIDRPVVSEIEQNGSGIDLQTIIHETEKNVVLIEVETPDVSRTGSGFIYNEKGDIVTNAHVVKDADVVYVRTANAHVYPAAVIGIGEETDVAVLRVPQLASGSYLPINEEHLTEIGDEIIAVGSPHGFQNTVTIGIISGLDRNLEVDGFTYDNSYQISAQITQGNSGGPLIHRQTGQVIGINAVGTNDGTIGFSIPISSVYEKLTEWSNEAVTDELEIAKISDRVEKLNEDQLQSDALYVIDYFFEGIKMRDFIGSYTLLGSDMQATQSYVDFRDEYIHSTTLSYDEPAQTMLDDHQVEIAINVTITSKEINEDKRTEDTVPYTFIVGLENDQVKILSYTIGE